MASDRLLSIEQAAAFYSCETPYIHQLLREKRLSDTWDKGGRAPRNALRISEIELTELRRTSRARGRGGSRGGRTSIAEITLVLAESDRRLSAAEAEALATRLEDSRRLEEEQVARLRAESEVERLRMQLDAAETERDRLGNRRNLLEHVIAQNAGPQSPGDLPERVG